MNSMNKKIFAALLCVASAAVYAASDGIMGNRNDECAIWLCLPGGFPGGCEAAYGAYIKRITTFTSGKHPERMFTDLPRFELCVDQNPAGVQDFNVGPQSKISYYGAYEVHMPAFNTCTRWAYRRTGNSSDNGDNFIKYCAAIKTTPARVFESSQKHHEYQTISVGDQEYSTHEAPTRHYTDVLVDDKPVGKRFYDGQN